MRGTVDTHSPILPRNLHYTYHTLSCSLLLNSDLFHAHVCIYLAYIYQGCQLNIRHCVKLGTVKNQAIRQLHIKNQAHSTTKITHLNSSTARYQVHDVTILYCFSVPQKMWYIVSAVSMSFRLSLVVSQTYYQNQPQSLIHQGFRPDQTCYFCCTKNVLLPP